MKDYSLRRLIVYLTNFQIDMLQLTILGTSAATPANYRHPTAQALQTPKSGFLIDCGEGTQIQLQRYHVRYNKIQHIFISHLHGDHYLGLIGLLSSFHLQKRVEDVNLFAPRDLAEIIRINLRYSHTKLCFKLNFTPLPENSTDIFFEDDLLTVATIPMNHRILCNGFLFREKPKKKKILEEKLPPNLPWRAYAMLKNGEDITDENGNIWLRCEDYTIQPKSYVFAHCSDTLYDEKIISQIAEADLIYHEATFLHQELEKANTTFHSTALQAASIAQKAQVGKLLIGHFSSRYKDITPLLNEAKSVFENTALCIEGDEHWLGKKSMVEKITEQE